MSAADHITDEQRREATRKTRRTWQLAMQIADQAARSDIESFLRPAAWEDDIVTHYDSKAPDPELQPGIDRAIEYLTLRGLIVRHHVRTDWVSVNRVPT